MDLFEVEINAPASSKKAVIEHVEGVEQGMEWARFGLLECPKVAAQIFMDLLRIKF